MISQPLSFAVPDNGLALTVGANKFSWWTDEARDVQCVRATLDTPQATGPKLTLDVKRSDGTSIFSTPLTFDNGQNTTAWATFPAVINNGNLAINERFQIDVLQSSGTAKGLKLTLYPYVPDFGTPPPPPPATWQTIATATLTNGNSASLAGYNMRQVVLKAGFASIATGTKIRLTLKAGTAATAISKMYVGPAGAAPNAVSLIPVTVGGNASFTIPAGGSVVTDELAFALDPTKDLIISLETANAVPYGNPSGAWARFGKAGGGSEAALLTVTGYSAYGWQLLISKVEVYA